MAKPGCTFSGDFETPEEHKKFKAIRSEMGFENWQDFVRYLYDAYENGTSEDPQLKEQLKALQAVNNKLKESNQQLLKEVGNKSTPRSNETLFIAKLEKPTHQKMIQQMRDNLEERHNYISDLQILLYQARLNRDLDNKIIHIIKPHRALNEKINDKGEALVHDGKYQNMNHFLSKMIEKGIAETLEKKSSWL